MANRRTELIQVDPAAPDPAAIERAAAVLRHGGLVAFPTETVYGLGADASSADAVAGIFEAKRRPSSDPLIVHLADASELPSVCSAVPAPAFFFSHGSWIPTKSCTEIQRRVSAALGPSSCEESEFFSIGWIYYEAVAFVL